MEANYFTILYWFCHTSTWILHECTRVPHPESPSRLPPHTIPLGHPSAPAPSILHWIWTGQSFLIWYYTCFNVILPNHPTFPLPQSPKDCSIHLCLFCCFAYRVIVAAAAAKSLQSCPTLCNPIDYGSLPGSAIPGILQARTQEWVAISFSNAWKWKVKMNALSRVWLLATPWTAAYQAPPSMGFSKQEYWSGVPLPSLGLSLPSF